ncbi:sugar-binding domain-containing protein [Streptococcus iniae]
METEVYVNGQKLGMHPNGYSHFSYDITDFLTSCGDNTLAIKVTNKIPSSRWYSGSWHSSVSLFGGDTTSSFKTRWCDG